MADNDIDLYADDIEQDFAQDEYAGENVDLYDDVIATTSAPNNVDNTDVKFENHPPNEGGTNGTVVPAVTHNPSGRRHQLYVGNLTWWTTDQDIANTIHSIGINDFHEVKFFEHRPNGQSKGFCVISLGSETSMRKCLELLPKKDLNGQNPVVTLTTKQALSNFESQSKTRPSPANNTNSRPPHPSAPNQGPMPNFGGRMPMNQGPMRPMGPPGMQGSKIYSGPRMQGPPGYNGPPTMNQQPPRFQGQPQWNGPPRPNGPGPNMGPMRPGPPAQGPPRPMFQGPPQGQTPRMPQQGPPPGGPGGMRPDWNRPPMQQGFPQGPPPMQGPPRGPPPMQGPPGVIPPQGPPQGPAPHVNPAFFPQAGGPPPMQMGGPGPGGPVNPIVMQQGPPHGPPHGPPMGPQQVPTHGPPHAYGPPSNMTQPPYGGPPPPEHRPDMPPISEQEFEDIMTRNRTVSSSAIGRAVSDAAAGEYASAIETLVTAISLIKQSKVAGDDRCKILISSLQDTLRGVEDKSYSSSRRDRSRSRDRSHRRARRERSSSRYRERSRDRERDRERERDRDRDRYYVESYRDRERDRERSRSRERLDRERERDYRDREAEVEQSRVARPRNKSPVEAPEATAEISSKSRYYDERSYRSERERESGRVRDSERERERDRREESHRSRH